MALDTSFNGIVSLISVFLFSTTVTVVLRFISRHRQKAGFWIDDYLAIAALVGFIGMATAVLYGVAHKFIGYREPKSKAIVNAVHPTMELTYISLDATQIWTFGTVKLCALFFYHRVFCTRVKRGIFDYATWFMIAIVSAWIIGFMVFTFEVCPGHSVSWYVQPGRIASCKPNLDYPYFDANTISDFVLDVLVLGMAFPKIWSFRLTPTQKIGISSVFLLALGGVAASCARMVIITHLVHTGRAINDEDGYQVNTQAAYYSLLEGGLGLVCVNLPTIWYFVTGVKPERVLYAVRSLISLSSNKSDGSRTSYEKSRNDSSYEKSRQESFARQSSVESNVVHENRSLDEQHLTELPKDGIQVEHAVVVQRQ